MKCGYCGKKLIEAKNFINENDIVECSSCRNTFKFIPENLKNKISSDAPEIQKKIMFRFSTRAVFSLLLILIYYLFSFDTSTTAQFSFFIFINIIPIIVSTTLNLHKGLGLPDYGIIFNDCYLFSFHFWNVLSEIAASILSLLFFFIIY